MSEWYLLSARFPFIALIVFYSFTVDRNQTSRKGTTLILLSLLCFAQDAFLFLLLMHCVCKVKQMILSRSEQPIACGLFDIINERHLPQCFLLVCGLV